MAWGPQRVNPALLAIHVQKQFVVCLFYCMEYGRQIWLMFPAPDKCKINGAWNNCFEKYLMSLGKKVRNHFVNILPVLLLSDYIKIF